jgi:erythromycin esterase-like protein
MAHDQLQLRAIRENSHPLIGPEDDRPLFDLIGDSRLVLIGEASHGTHEFYRTRAQITKRLIQEKGFTAVAAEADWPDAHRVNRYVSGRGEDKSVAQALNNFRRFPARGAPALAAFCGYDCHADRSYFHLHSRMDCGIDGLMNKTRSPLKGFYFRGFCDPD